MKSILEQALVHLLNQENEKAQELFHQYVIKEARDIHDSLRENDDEENMEEEFFTEDDLDMDVSDEDMDDAEMDLSDLEVSGDDIEDDELSSESDVSEDEDMDDKIEDIESELDDLKAKFDDLVATYETEYSDEGEGEDESDEAAEELGDEMDVEADDEYTEMDEMDEIDMNEMDDEMYEDITEAIMDELKNVKVSNTDGSTTDGKNIGKPSGDSLRFDSVGKPSPAKSKKGGEHMGHDRETPPSSTELSGSKSKVSNMYNARMGKKTEMNTIKGGKPVKNGEPKSAKLNTKPADQKVSTLGRTKNTK